MAQKPRRVTGLTRVQLSERLRIGHATIERLVAGGLAPVGTRGRAHTYRLSDARRVRQQLAARDAAPDDVLILDYATHADDLRDRRQRLLSDYVADITWRPPWRRVVATVDMVTRSWPRRLAARFGAIPRDQAPLAMCADGPQVQPPLPLRCLGPDRVREILAGDPATYPWRPPATAGIAALVERGVGVMIWDGSGAWSTWDPARPIPQPIAYPTPIVRPLLEELADAIGTSPAIAALARALIPPAAERTPRAPRTVDQARARWRASRSAYRRARVAIRRGHHRRADISAAVTTAIGEFRAAWWGARGQLGQLAGDGLAVLAAADRLRVESLTRLSTLGGLVPPASRRTT